MIFNRKPVFITLVLLCLTVCIFSSCSEQARLSVKNFPADTPFVAHNRIVLRGNLPKDEKNRLLTALENYWDDSLLARKVQRFGFFYRLRNPPIFDTQNIRRTILFMNGYMNSQGYYYATYDDTFFVTRYHKKNPELRTTMIMNIDPGKNIMIDSLSYHLIDSNLQRLALASQKETMLKKGKPYSKEIVANELGRLVTVYRQNGYYQLSRDNLLAEADTTDKALLQLTVDPFELASKLAEAAERRKKNPTVDMRIYDRGDYYKTHYADTSMLDSASLKQYYIGNIYYYPETKATEIPDSLINKPVFQTMERKSFTIYYKEGLFKDRPFRDHSYLRRGSLYNEELYYKTMTNFSNIGAWGQVDSRTVIRGDSLDFHIFLSPSIKQNITYDLEASRNTGDVIGSSNLFGIASSITYRNRNVAKRAIQAVTSLRGGVELNLDQSADLLQTTQVSANQRYAFPRFIAPWRIKGGYKMDAIQTVFNVNGSYINRKQFYELRSLVTSWGYEWKKKNRLWSYKPLNIELYALDTLEGLRNAFKTNPLLRTAFNTGSVVSQVLTYTVTYPSIRHPNTSNYLRFAVEEAGGLLGRVKDLQDRIYQYIKFEAEYKRAIQYRKTTLALRAYGGAGVNYSSESKFGKTLPFFKQFIAGGPNSMRAWGLRQLGLGSSLLSDTSGAFRDRFGDMQLEVNAEYRYKIATIGSIQVAGALFTDAGNIWNIKNDPENPKGVFTLTRFAKDIAIGIGTGIRFDFNYFLIRIDGGLKLKDPARLSNNGWLNFSNFTWTNDEFKVIDATDASGQRVIKRNNYAIQLGIGLPF
jgi:hypothetical protein